MEIDVQRVADLRKEYRNALVTIANEIGSADRSPVNGVALVRIRQALGFEVDPPTVSVPEPELKKRIVEYVLSLRQVLKELLTLDAGPEHQSVIGDLEADLNSLLQTSL